MSGEDLGDMIISGVESVTATYAKQRKAEERHANAALHRRDAMTRIRRVKINEAAFEVMEAAYLDASDNGQFYANARQIAYAARPHILARTGKEDLGIPYFTQTLLPAYLDEHGLDGVWKIAYDARGHFTEPHLGRRIALGTAEVRSYAAGEPDDPQHIGGLPLGFPTAGPLNRYAGVVFIEKEGFDQQIAQSGLAAEHDLAFMSTKGMSVTAARELVDYLAGEGVLVFVLHDFDRSGFSILGTLGTDSRRYQFGNTPEVIDLGLRLADVEEHGLPSEPWRAKANRRSIERTLRRHGATDAEVAFLVRAGSYTFTAGQRVELNALTAGRFIDWLDGKLAEHAPGKVMPDDDTLTVAYRRARTRIAINKKITEMAESLSDETNAETVPDDLEAQIRRKLETKPELSWDTALAGIAEGSES